MSAPDSKPLFGKSDLVSTLLKLRIENEVVDVLGPIKI
jgi:hypothetical protein